MVYHKKWGTGCKEKQNIGNNGRNPANQLRLVVYPIIYRVFSSQVVSRISSIKSMALT